MDTALIEIGVAKHYFLLHFISRKCFSNWRHTAGEQWQNVANWTLLIRSRPSVLLGTPKTWESHHGHHVRVADLIRIQLYTITNDLGHENLKFPLPSPLALALVSAFFSDSSYIPSASPLPLLTPSSVGQSHSPPDHCFLTILPHINQDTLLTFFSSSLALFFANLSLTCQDKYGNMSELLRENQGSLFFLISIYPYLEKTPNFSRFYKKTGSIL